MKYLFYQVRRQDLYLIKFILEAYENLMTVSTIDKQIGKIQITIAPDFFNDAKAILHDLTNQFEMIFLDEDENISQGNY